MIAIILTLAAVTFPVFNRAKAAAQRTVCASNMHQIALAVNMYADDYDSYFMLTSEHPGPDANSRNDRTWVQLVLPYTRSFSIFHCPGDYSTKPKAESTFDQDLVPGDTDSRYYTASMHTNYGFNYQYLSPIVQGRTEWMPMPKPTSGIKQPSSTVMIIDSVWTRLEDGSPFGGGNYLVTPPCRYRTTRDGSRMDSFNQYTFGDVKVFTTSLGWDTSNGNSASFHGNAWPWHNGRMNLGMVDGSVRSMSPEQLSDGCDLEEEWRGSITDVDSYLWDTQ
jgi:prepilin-type processing-associated H-X9-DG protein